MDPEFNSLDIDGPAIDIMSCRNRQPLDASDFFLAYTVYNVYKSLIAKKSLHERKAREILSERAGCNSTPFDFDGNEVAGLIARCVK